MSSRKSAAGFQALLCVVLAVLATAARPATNLRDLSDDRARIQAIFAAHDRLGPGMDEYMSAVADDVILMPNGGKLVEGKAAYRQHVQEFYAAGTIDIRHELIEVSSFPEVVIARGRAVGSFTPPGGTATTFETRNLFVFRRMTNGRLQVWQIIYNDAPKGP
jgi:ketosteroid isomerase-like protein